MFKPNFSQQIRGIAHQIMTIVAGASDIPLIHSQRRSYAPVHTSKTGMSPAKNKRQALKRRAVKRARKLGHS